MAEKMRCPILEIQKIREDMVIYQAFMRYLPSVSNVSSIEGCWPLFPLLRSTGLNDSSQLVFDKLALLFDLPR